MCCVCVCVRLCARVHVVCSGVYACYVCTYVLSAIMSGHVCTHLHHCAGTCKCDTALVGGTLRATIHLPVGPSLPSSGQDWLVDRDTPQYPENRGPPAPNGQRPPVPHGQALVMGEQCPAFHGQAPVCVECIQCPLACWHLLNMCPRMWRGVDSGRSRSSDTRLREKHWFIYQGCGVGRVLGSRTSHTGGT